jgi:hypothetical protein
MYVCPFVYVYLYALVRTPTLHTAICDTKAAAIADYVLNVCMHVWVYVLLSLFVCTIVLLKTRTILTTECDMNAGPIADYVLGACLHVCSSLYVQVRVMYVCPLVYG